MGQRNEWLGPVSRAAPLFVVASLVLIFAWGDLEAAVQSTTLVETRAVITQSTLTTVSSMSSDGTPSSSDAASIGFRYWVDSEPREGSGVYLADPTPVTSLFTNANALLEEYPVGRETKAYYDPEDPSVASLRRGFGASTWGLLVLLGSLFLVGLFILLWGWSRGPGLLRSRPR